MAILLNILWLFISLVLIGLVLIQRGKGGGLAGAFGGAGGSSAFGARATDVFTKFTVIVFGVWLLVAVLIIPAMTPTNVFQGGAQAVSTPVVTPTSDGLNAPNELGGGDGGPIPPITAPTKGAAADQPATPKDANSAKNASTQSSADKPAASAPKPADKPVAKESKEATPPAQKNAVDKTAPTSIDKGANKAAAPAK